MDLVASTRLCTNVLFPRIRPGGVLFSQDGHLRGTVDLYEDAAYWQREVGVQPPRIEGLGDVKMLEVHPV